MNIYKKKIIILLNKNLILNFYLNYFCLIVEIWNSSLKANFCQIKDINEIY